MKAAFPSLDERLAPVFDNAREVHIVLEESGRITGESKQTMPEFTPLQKALWLVEQEVGTLVCGAVSRELHQLILSYGIQVIPFMAGGLREVIQAWVKGQLGRPVFAMPGCRRKGRGRFGRYGDSRWEVAEMTGQGRGQGAGRGGGKQGTSGSRMGRGGGPAQAGPAGECVCPQCGLREPHERGRPCSSRTCPKCGVPLTRD